jgi:hypothetical protein
MPCEPRIEPATSSLAWSDALLNAGSATRLRRINHLQADSPTINGVKGWYSAAIVHWAAELFWRRSESLQRRNAPVHEPLYHVPMVSNFHSSRCKSDNAQS